MANQDVRDVLRGDPYFFKRVQNEGAICDHAWISHHNRIIALNESDSTGHASGTCIRCAGDELTALDGLDVSCGENGDFIHDVPSSQVEAA